MQKVLHKRWRLDKRILSKTRSQPMGAPGANLLEAHVKLSTPAKMAYASRGVPQRHTFLDVVERPGKTCRLVEKRPIADKAQNNAPVLSTIWITNSCFPHCPSVFCNLLHEGIKDFPLVTVIFLAQCSNQEPVGERMTLEVALHSCPSSTFCPFAKASSKNPMER